MSYVEASQQKSWWGRNWVWVVPLGCLTPIVLVVGCMIAAYFAVSGIIKNTDVYFYSVAAVSKNEAVKTALGEPISPGLQFQGDVKLNNDDGTADITYNISGPKGAGTVHVVATKSDGVWTYQTNKVHINATNEDIDVPVDSSAKPE
jgi:hypothetical protein